MPPHYISIKFLARKRLAKTILLSGVGINFLFFTGVVIFTKVNLTDKWVLFMYGSMIWLGSGRTYQLRK